MDQDQKQRQPVGIFGLYFMARNTRGRPTLQHMLDEKREGYTVCGTYVVGWSRVYMDHPLKGFYCRRCEVYSAGRHNHPPSTH